MVAAKEWTKTDPKDDKIIVLTTRLSKLEKDKTSVLATVQGGRANTTQTRTKIKRRDPNESYAEGLANIESWCITK